MNVIEGSSATSADAHIRAAPPSQISEELIDKTIAVWGPRYGRTLSREEGRQILVNAMAFFRALASSEGNLEDESDRHDQVA